jgi:flavin reductase (DIM6/NTAB) family NADH-FMN oxidoreductase RutF
MHNVISPAIFYWGTPVVIITTENEDGTFNMAPMSSAWWLSNHCMLGLAQASQTTKNLLRTKQCVLNLPSGHMVDAVNKLAKTTGAINMSPFKISTGYRYVKDKFAHTGLTAAPSDVVRPPRIAECFVQMEAELVTAHDVGQGAGTSRFAYALDVKIVRTHVEEGIRLSGHHNRIDPDKWRPLIMSFQEFYTLEPGKLEQSVLAEIDEEAYRPLIGRAATSEVNPSSS